MVNVAEIEPSVQPGCDCPSCEDDREALGWAESFAPCEADQRWWAEQTGGLTGREEAVFDLALFTESALGRFLEECGEDYRRAGR